MLNLGRKEQIIILIVLAIVIFSAGYQLAGREKTDVELESSSNAEATNEQSMLVVHVDGAVQKPGVYKFSPGSRVNDAVEEALASPDADLSSLNLAAPLKDGQKLVVPARVNQQVQEQPVLPALASGGQVAANISKPATKQSSPSTSKTSGLININTASESELDVLPGIGPALAMRIIEYRQTNGPFQSTDELKNVSGIGEKKFADLQHIITVQ